MNAVDLIALAERYEKAEGPDHMLSKAVAVATGWRPVPNPTHAGGLMGRWYRPDGTITDHFGYPGFTTSLDAAMSLVPEGCGWRVWAPAADTKLRHRATIWAARGMPMFSPFDVEAATAALALTAAALRARAAQGTEAQRATTPKSGVVHDGPVAEGDAPK